VGAGVGAFIFIIALVVGWYYYRTRGKVVKKVEEGQTTTFMTDTQMNTTGRFSLAFKAPYDF
jgi:hypothetical protein